MPTVQKSVLLPYSAQQMFDLVSDVKSYPQFLPWCGGARARELGPDSVQATLDIDYHGLRQSFTTRNDHVVPTSIAMQLVDGPFSRLTGQWQFRELRKDACKVEFKLEYSFAGGLLAHALAPVFGHIAGSMVDAFVQRAQAVYG